MCRRTHTLPLSQCRLTYLWTATHYTAHITSQLPLRHLLWNGKNEAALGEDTLGMDCRTRGRVHHRTGSSWQTNIPHTRINHCYKSMCVRSKKLFQPSEVKFHCVLSRVMGSWYTICHNTRFCWHKHRYCMCITTTGTPQMKWKFPPHHQRCPANRHIVCLSAVNISMTNVTPWSCSKSLLVNCRLCQL